MTRGGSGRMKSLLGKTASSKAKKEEKASRDRQQLHSRRAEVILKLEAVGLRATRMASADNERIYILVTAPVGRLEEQAERREIRMQLKSKYNDKDRPSVACFQTFTRARRHEFHLKKGRLFSTLERQRLIFSIIVSPEFQNGAELDLDELEDDDVIETYTPLHTTFVAKRQEGDEDTGTNDQDRLLKAWTRIGVWPHKTGWGDKTRRLFPDLGLLQQPLGEVREVFGEKIAFYFAWLEHYSEALLVLMIFGFVIGIILFAAPSISTIGVPLYAICLGLWTTMLDELWKRRNAELCYRWDADNIKETPEAKWTASYSKGVWKHRKEGEGHWWSPPGGVMVKERGFYDATGMFVPHEDAPLRLRMNVWYRTLTQLVGMLPLMAASCLMLIGALSILTFRMLMSIGSQYEDYRAVGSGVGSVLNVAWVSIMNVVYRTIAVKLNSLENHRTASEYENALIMKTFAFQFINSYTSLYYIAFAKLGALSLFSAFGASDPGTGDAYYDQCGKDGSIACEDSSACEYANVRPGCDHESGEGCHYVFIRDDSDCMRELQIQMISFICMPIAVQIPLQMLMPILVTRFNAWWNSRGDPTPTPPAADDDAAKFRDKIQEELHRPEFEGTFAECAARRAHHYPPTPPPHTPPLAAPGRYSTKIIQYGYVALFSVAFPLAPLAAAFANFIELRADAFKVAYGVRRPRYRAAKDIGAWSGVLRFLSWLSLLTNTLLIAFTSQGIRDELLIPSMVDKTCDSTDDPFFLSDRAKAGHSAFTNTSWISDCQENYYNCYESIGGVEWLPGTTFLDEDSAIALPYVGKGLCNKDSLLYNEAHCETCQVRMAAVGFYLIMFVLVLEHSLVLLKFALAWGVPDEPRWVTRAEARQRFYAENREKEDAKALRTPSWKERSGVRDSGSSDHSELDPEQRRELDAEAYRVKQIRMEEALRKEEEAARQARAEAEARADAEKAVREAEAEKATKEAEEAKAAKEAAKGEAKAKGGQRMRAMRSPMRLVNVRPGSGMKSNKV